MATATGTVSQANLIGDELLFTDTGSYGTIISRVLTVYDANGVVLGAPYNMGTNLTQLVPITADIALTFICIVTDNAGVYTITVICVSDGFYAAQFLEVLSNLGCNCECDAIDNLIKGEIYLSAADRYGLSDLLPAAQQAITTANTWVNNVY